MNKLHFEILDEARRNLLPCFSSLKDRFYLAGGTALALQIGHRDSIDFDFFSESSFETTSLFAECEKIFAEHTLLRTQDERDTLGILVDNSVQISFMGFPYPLVESLLETPEMNLASIADIGCMKLSAITSRSAVKDYVDIFFILRQLSLSKLLSQASRKFPTLDQNLILKSLVYFDDVSNTAIKYSSGSETSFDDIQKALQKEVEAFVRSGRTDV